ncbi:MAG: flagellin [Planctomycetota bacterium]|nr:MAG: flagellin [Planctomycetota bacterium]
MSRINTNIPSMIAQRVFNAQNRGLSESLTRLSTGLRINTGKDDPAGLIASEALRTEKVAIGAAITNVSRANNVVSTAEGGLDEINKLLTELEDLVDRSANVDGISEDERDANQLQIDAIIDSINRIANSTEFQGKKLLSGELDYTTSGIDTNNFTDVAINSARVPNGGVRDVIVEVTQSAQLANLIYSGTATGSGTTTLQIVGANGAETLSFGSATAISAVATAVNASTELTGVTARVSGSNLVFESTDYGSDQFVTVRALQGTFTVTGGDSGTDTDRGRDAGVLINGITANVRGLNARLQSTTLSVEMRLSSTFGTTLGSDSFSVTGGGALFQISPTVELSGQANIGIRAVSAGSLGNNVDGFISSLASGQTNALTQPDGSDGNFAVAQRIIRAAQTQVAELRGRLGAFQKDTLETTANALAITLENTTAAESTIRDTDFASETSNLTRAQILVQSATNTLRLANTQPQTILSLLG